MKYVVLGAGGVGATISAYMTQAGKDVTLLARGEHLEKIKANGLQMHTAKHGEYSVPLHAVSEEELKTECAEAENRPDVIFLCTKTYSMKETVPTIQAIAKPETVVIPLLNGIDVGSELQEMLPELLIPNGLIYISAFRSAPGEITQPDPIFRIIYGVKDPEVLTESAIRAMVTARQDLLDANCDVSISDNILRDCLQKFSMVSPMGGAGIYYETNVGGMQQAGEAREFFKALVKEIDNIATALGMPFLIDVVKSNMDRIDANSPAATASMQKDYEAGVRCEADYQILAPIKLGESLGVDMSHYRMVAEKMNLI